MSEEKTKSEYLNRLMESPLDALMLKSNGNSNPLPRTPPPDILKYNGVEVTDLTIDEFFE